MASPNAVPASVVPVDRTIPFDYAFRFEFDGNLGSLRKTVTVSVEGVFRAVSIGFGFVPDAEITRFGLPTPAAAAGLRPFFFAASAPPLGVATSLDTTTLGHVMLGAVEALTSAGRTPRAKLFERALERPFRINPEVAAELAADPASVFRGARRAELFEVATGPEDVQVQFLYGLFDDGSGREFQSELILSTAGLGISNGDRPFRRFPVPIEFQPRSVIRMEVQPTVEVTGELHIALHGYKVLPPPRVSEAQLRSEQRASSTRRRSRRSGR